ncbi:hypothetical protein QEZ54_35430 [Catellatospora sp. KI3]|uniref:hypothetical protein n=1 Tax=Catellatospora sp. KI3 TaxID=3041620 RepID=UPI0024823275|nr:hypothetical protein [Catellatospora sp. KI3]MDI1466283.1 hypothetical protein [Catellatospora sp. KI3]
MANPSTTGPAPVTDAEVQAELSKWTGDGADITPLAYAVRIAIRQVTGSVLRPELARAVLAELARLYPPQYITAAQPQHDTVWHLVNRYGQAVEAGRYCTADSAVFDIGPAPDLLFDTAGMPARVRIRWKRPESPDYRYLRELVSGWCWVPEHRPQAFEVTQARYALTSTGRA